MTERVERVLRVAAPVVAMAAVALGLCVGAPTPLRKARVTGAPPSNAGTGLAWQVLALDGSGDTWMPLAGVPLRAVARQGGEQRTWSGRTNEDGVAEMALAFARPEGLYLELASGPSLLAAGDVTLRAVPLRAPPESPWARFARREGSLLLDVVVLGQRAASGFPATVWVHAADATSHRAASGITVEPEVGTSFVPRENASKTDSAGWAQVVATPWGHAVAMVLHAHAPDGRKGDWAGLFEVSPGAPDLVMPDRVGPDEAPEIEVVTQTTRPTAYVEVDDAYGRAWGGVLRFVAREDAAPRAIARPPKLAPGLYWIVAGYSDGSPSPKAMGTRARPFFVAATDEAALPFGLDAAECVRPTDLRELARALSVCLALAPAPGMPTWVALEGLTHGGEGEASRRAFGLGIALVAIVVGAILETLLLVRATLRARARLRAAMEDGGGEPAPVVDRGWFALMAILVALLGFALMAAFVGRLR